MPDQARLDQPDMAPHKLSWQWAHFDQLTATELYEILRARSAVFVVEQLCPFQDCDGVDRCAHHLWTTDAGSEVAAYLRVVPPGVKYVEPSIGRIITSGGARGRGLGRILVAEGIRRTEVLYGARPIRIGAQRYLVGFYSQFGFEPTGYDYDEDGIAHSEMIRVSGATRNPDDPA